MLTSLPTSPTSMLEAWGSRALPEVLELSAASDLSADRGLLHGAVAAAAAFPAQVNPRPGASTPQSRVQPQAPAAAAQAAALGLAGGLPPPPLPEASQPPCSPRASQPTCRPVALQAAASASSPQSDCLSPDRDWQPDQEDLLLPPRPPADRPDVPNAAVRLERRRANNRLSARRNRVRQKAELEAAKGILRREADAKRKEETLELGWQRMRQQILDNAREHIRLTAWEQTLTAHQSSLNDRLSQLRDCLTPLQGAHAPVAAVLPHLAPVPTAGPPKLALPSPAAPATPEPQAS